MLMDCTCDRQFVFRDARQTLLGTEFSLENLSILWRIRQGKQIQGKSFAKKNIGS